MGKMILKKSSIIGVAILLSLSLTACGEDEKEQVSNQAAASDGKTDGGTESTDPTGEDRDTKTPPEEPAQPAIDYNNPAECIVGDWSSDLGIFFSSVAEMGGGQLVEVTGEVDINFDTEGAFTTHYNDWNLVFAVDGTQVEIIRTGVDTGSYELPTPTKINLKDTSLNSTLKISAPGYEMNIDPVHDELIEAPFSCTETEISITSDGVAHLMQRR